MHRGRPGRCGRPGITSRMCGRALVRHGRFIPAVGHRSEGGEGDRTGRGAGPPGQHSTAENPERFRLHAQLDASERDEREFAHGRQLTIPRDLALLVASQPPGDALMT